MPRWLQVPSWPWTWPRICVERRRGGGGLPIATTHAAVCRDGGEAVEEGEFVCEPGVGPAVKRVSLSSKGCWESGWVRGCVGCGAGRAGPEAPGAAGASAADEKARRVVEAISVEMVEDRIEPSSLRWFNSVCHP